MKKFLCFLLAAFLLLTLAACDNVIYPDTDKAGNSFRGNVIKSVSEDERERELIAALVEYLDQYNVDYDMADIDPLAVKIDKIKGGTQPLLVSFDPDSYYYVCGYYTENESHSEAHSYCCSSEYTWIEYQSVTDIQDSYNGEKCVVAFQVNKSKLVSDIRDESIAVPDIEHFQMFETRFVGGKNVNPPMDFSSEFIYLNSSDKDVIFYTISTFHSWKSISCIQLDGEYYISLSLEHRDGYHSFEWEFDSYYDTLMEIMDTELYNNKTNDISHRYGLIGVRDFVNKVLK